jgi:parallel beta helix pectate lyase-like protein
MVKKVLISSFFLLIAGVSRAATLQVGPGKHYATPCAALAIAAAGDTIQIDPVLYGGDVCAFSQNNLTIQGVNGRAHIDANKKSAQEKGIWVVSGGNILIENIEFSGAISVDRNGAGIRAQGVNLTVRNCYFHDNQDGILESNIARSNIIIEYSEFARNGYGDGGTHNVYIGHAASLTFRFNYSHDSIVGHLLKSRAAVNYVLYNRLTDQSGTGSYEIDLPNGGTSYVVGNLIEQGPSSQNSNILSYLEEGLNSQNPGMDLYVVNNTFVNDLGRGTFVLIGTADTLPAVIKNNIFAGLGAFTNQSGAVMLNNFTGNPLFVNQANYDYHLAANSPAIDRGDNPGSANGYSLTPTREYVHPACGEVRKMAGAAIDAGAYEYAGAGVALACR